MFLRSLTYGQLRVLDVIPLQVSVALDSWMGTDPGICPWDSALVMRKFYGGTFWVGCGWFSLGLLSGGDGDGEETTPVHVHQGRFRWTTRVVKHPHFYVICYILNSGSFSSS